jgi:hypothetical protein
MKAPIVLISCLALTAALSVPASRASANPFGGTGPSVFTPRVPISALARPVAWLDPSRFHVSSSVSMGSGFGGGVDALQTLSLSYRFAAPAWMNVSLGNTWGPDAAGGRNSMFLEGVDFAFRPSASTFFEFRYQNLRSPLQRSPVASGFWGP